MAVKHAFTSPKADGADDTIVQAGDWNDGHTHEAEAKNLVFAGPVSGANASPTFRSLVAADLPAGTDHALLGNLDYASAGHTGFLAADGSVVGATGEAQDFGSLGILTDSIKESTSGAGITVTGGASTANVLTIITDLGLPPISGTNALVDLLPGVDVDANNAEMIGLRFRGLFYLNAFTGLRLKSIQLAPDINSIGAGVLAEVDIAHLSPVAINSTIFTSFRYLNIDPQFMDIAAASGEVIGLNVKNIGNANWDNVYGIRMAALTAGTNTYQIKQEGTTGFNVLAGNTRIGATTDPTVALDVTGAAIVSDTLQAVRVGINVAPDATVPLFIRDTVTAGHIGLSTSDGTGVAKGFINLKGSGSDNDLFVDLNVTVADAVVDAGQPQWRYFMSNILDQFGLQRSPAGASWSPVTLLKVASNGDTTIIRNFVIDSAGQRGMFLQNGSGGTLGFMGKRADSPAALTLYAQGGPFAQTITTAGVRFNDQVKIGNDTNTFAAAGVDLEVINKLLVGGEIETGGFAAAIVAKTGAYTAASGDFVILCDASGGAFTVTLPAASGIARKIYHVKKTDSSGNAVTVDGNASETIDGGTTAVLSAQYESIKIICDGSNWHIL